MSDEDVDISDTPPLSDGFFGTAEWRMGKKSGAVMIRLDPELIGWFRLQGGQWEERVNAALRQYVESHRTSQGESGTAA